MRNSFVSSRVVKIICNTNAHRKFISILFVVAFHATFMSILHDLYSGCHSKIFVLWILALLVPLFNGHVPQQLQISVWQYLCIESHDVLQSCKLS